MISPEIFTAVINSYLPEPQASLLNGILFGVDVKASGEFYYQLKRVGLLHIVVLSGINITLLGVMVSHATSKFSKKISACVTIITIVLFILFVGPDPPIVRAGIMGVLSLVAILFERKKFALYSLFISIVCILLFKAEWLKTISFQLSFGATLGIILFGPKVSIAKGTIPSRFKSEITKDLRTTFSAQLFTVPIIFFYFKQISTIAPLSNILVSFFIPPLMIFGFATALFGKIHYILGLLPAYICYGILTYMVFIIKGLSKVPYGFFVWAPQH